MYRYLFSVFLAATASLSALPKPDRGGVGDTGPYDYGVMGPPTSPAIVAEANNLVEVPLPPGPYQATWDSIRAHYQVPAWFDDAKFGIFMHWGLYSVSAHRNEWYEKHMYAADLDWHTEHFGAPVEFGYKDFIPLFKAEKWNPRAWAELFRKSGARLVMPCAQHHDNFALWDSEVTRFNAKRMGPKRDLIGDLATAVRGEGLKFGVSNHGIENFSFIDPSAEVLHSLRDSKADLFDPEWADFYHVADRSDEAQARFLADWLRRNFELIDKYRPDMLWFDNGVNLRHLDPLKERVAAYYYNRAVEWKKQVSLSTKFIACAPTNNDAEQVGSIIDFEKVGSRSPAGIRPGSWMVDDPIGTSWGYVEGMRAFSADSILGKLVDTVSKGGFYLLNIAPMADGTIPADQEKSLLGIGAWLDLNGEAIFGTRPWKQHAEGEIRFTTKGDLLYAIIPASSEDMVKIKSLSGGCRVAKVELVGKSGQLVFAQTADALEVELPSSDRAHFARALRITPGN